MNADDYAKNHYNDNIDKLNWKWKRNSSYDDKSFPLSSSLYSSLAFHQRLLNTRPTNIMLTPFRPHLFAMDNLDIDQITLVQTGQLKTAASVSQNPAQLLLQSLLNYIGEGAQLYQIEASTLLLKHLRLKHVTWIRSYPAPPSTHPLHISSEIHTSSKGLATRVSRRQQVAADCQRPLHTL